ncbi:SLAM family member 5-like [Aythya fuligula]|uniref:SLAM family member 5-like n=1 Tax=Aythya fuligula TaxID=219594 RepID=A0A6J3EDQ9_AYTFU|nr:SLAM family member 5-like [Aythya fuligula]
MGEPWGRRRPLHPRLLALLLIAAGSAGAQLQLVSGVRGRSVLLSPALPNSSEVKTAEWYFRTGTGKKIRVAEFGPKGFERPNPHDRFQQRLEMPNATALRIGGLELGDSGIYGVWIKYNSTVEVEDQVFNLSVYDPVPPPQIHPQLLSRSPQGCNVTLRCSLPNTSFTRTSWQLGNTSGTLWEQSGDGQTLWLAIPPGALNDTYTCVARSPAEEQSTSVSLRTLCQLAPPVGGRREGEGGGAGRCRACALPPGRKAGSGSGRRAGLLGGGGGEGTGARPEVCGRRRRFRFRRPCGGGSGGGGGGGGSSEASTTSAPRPGRAPPPSAPAPPPQVGPGERHREPGSWARPGPAAAIPEGG